MINLANQRSGAPSIDQSAPTVEQSAPTADQPINFQSLLSKLGDMARGAVSGSAEERSVNQAITNMRAEYEKVGE